MLAQISGALELNFASTHWFLGRILTLVFDQLRVIFGFVFGRIFGHFVAGLRAIIWGLLWTPFRAFCSRFTRNFWARFGRLFGHFVAGFLGFLCPISGSAKLAPVPFWGGFWSIALLQL